MVQACYHFSQVFLSQSAYADKLTVMWTVIFLIAASWSHIWSRLKDNMTLLPDDSFKLQAYLAVSWQSIQHQCSKQIPAFSLHFYMHFLWKNIASGMVLYPKLTFSCFCRFFLSFFRLFLAAFVECVSPPLPESPSIGASFSRRQKDTTWSFSSWFSALCWIQSDGKIFLVITRHHGRQLAYI